MAGLGILLGFGFFCPFLDPLWQLVETPYLTWEGLASTFFFSAPLPPSPSRFLLTGKLFGGLSVPKGGMVWYGRVVCSGGIVKVIIPDSSIQPYVLELQALFCFLPSQVRYLLRFTLRRGTCAHPSVLAVHCGVSSLPP